MSQRIRPSEKRFESHLVEIESLLALLKQYKLVEEPNKKLAAFKEISSRIAEATSQNFSDDEGRFSFRKVLQPLEYAKFLANIGFSRNNVRLPIRLTRIISNKSNVIDGYIVFGEKGPFVADNVEKPVEGCNFTEAEIEYVVNPNFENWPFTIDSVRISAQRRNKLNDERMETVTLEARFPLSWKTIDATDQYPEAVEYANQNNLQRPLLDSYESKQLPYNYVTQEGYVYFPHLGADELRDLNHNVMNTVYAQ